MWTRLSEFMEDDTQHLSMTRLLCFLSFFPASYVVIMDADAETLGWYLGAYVLSYVGGKTADKLGSPKIVNVKNIENAENLTKEGNVNVESPNNL